MGVPELLKFAAKAPGALSRIRQNGNANVFDYVLVDGTNVMQTVGVDAVVSLLSSSSIVIRESVFLLFDSQRDRAGTAREQRSHLSSHSLDVGAQQLCSSLAEAMKRKGVKIFMSGRDVEGEADYKLLHLHRGLATAAKSQQHAIPKFLFVSEDSDVLAGALCGPAPSNCWLATRLRDATQELCLLSVATVTTWLTGIGRADIAYEEPVVEVVEEDMVPVHDVGAEEPFESRHKKDGPMIGMGTATYFADSDDDEDNAKVIGAPATPVAPIEVSQATPLQKEKARRQQSASVDLNLLFLLLKGSGYLAPIIKGATKVDMASIWASYMHLGRSIVAFEGDAVRFDGAGLAKVLQSSHLFDSMSRPANSEEIEGAKRYLSAVSKVLLRGIIAFRGPKGSLDLVDGRLDQIVEPPTLAAFYALLDQTDAKVYTTSVFPPSTKLVANPIEESMMALLDGMSRPIPAPHALPSVKVGVVQTLSSSSISSLVDLFLDITIREALTARPDGELSSFPTTAAFSFDLRRMVGVDATSKKESRSAVLAAAGLSTGYSYAIDPARVLARLKPNMKQPVQAEEEALPPVVVPAPEVSAVADQNNRVPSAKQQSVRGIDKTPMGKPRRVASIPKSGSDLDAAGSRKGKKRLGKKERVMLAKKMGGSK